MINQHPIDKLAGAFASIPTPIQLAKIVEEVGEASEAYIGMVGANPRKGETHTMEDFHTELLDVALTALMLYRNTGGGPPLGRLSAHIEARWERHEREVPSSIPCDSRGAMIKIGYRVVSTQDPEGFAGTVLGTRSGFGLPEPEALVRWENVEGEHWHRGRGLTVSLTEERPDQEVVRGWNIERTNAPRDWRGATILPAARVMLRETPAGPRGTVIDNAPDGVQTAQHEVLVRWDSMSSDVGVWEVASSLEIA